MAVSKEAPKTHILHPHTSKKISEMIIVLVVVLLLLSMAVFITQIYGIPRTVVNNYYTYNQVAANELADQKAFQPILAPAGQAVAGYPKALIPAHGMITASYHNQYNGFDQYTLVVAAKTAMAGEYTALQGFLSANKFTITKKTASSTGDTINAQQGSDYVTVQLVPTTSTTTTVTINYGVPIK